MLHGAEILLAESMCYFEIHEALGRSNLRQAAARGPD